MARTTYRTAWLAALVLTASTVRVAAEDHKPAINAAMVSADQTTLFVDGENLDSRRRLSVLLGEERLRGVVVDVSGRRLTALLPDSIVPGTYLLRVTSRNWTAQFAVAIGLTGPAGPAGPSGETGPAGEPGAHGEPGESGAEGPAGATGAEGPAGPSGPPGLRGSVGPAGATGPAGPKTVYFAGSVRGDTTIKSGMGFSVLRVVSFKGGYRITIPVTSPGRTLLTTVTPLGLNTLARVVVSTNGPLEHTVDIETRGLPSLGLIDSDFNFIAIEQ